MEEASSKYFVGQNDFPQLFTLVKLLPKKETNAMIRKKLKGKH